MMPPSSGRGLGHISYGLLEGDPGSIVELVPTGKFGESDML